MSTLWTPSGERPIPRKPDPAAGGTPGGGPSGGGPGGRPGGGPGGSGPGGSGPGGGEPSEEQVRAELAELQAQLARTPAAVVVANHAFGLFELAALHLSLDPPQLDQARVAIDALAALVEGLGDRLGSHAQELSTGLSQLRMAYVQISGAGQGAAGGSGAGESGAGGAGG
jgi:hypothetical protein